MRKLHAVRAPLADERGLEYVSFCGHCGMPPAATVQSPGSRVCGHCGLGLVLQAASDVSARAEELLGTDETLAVNQHIADFLVPADANAPSAENLLVLLVDAASGSG